MAGVPAGIRNENFPNMSLDYCIYISLFGVNIIIIGK
jgi:hypothetical protein